MKTLIKILAILILNLVFSIQSSLSNEKFRIGLIVPLSGEYSEIGNSIVRSVRLAINKIDDNKILILPKDTRSNPIDALKVSKELYDQGVNIIIGPVFNESTKYLDDLKEVTFISLTNKIRTTPSNVISAGVNAISQINTIKKFIDLKKLERTIFLIPNSDYKNELEFAIEKTKFKLKEKFIYDQDPTILTSQIEKLTRYPQRKRNLEDEIKRLEESNIANKEKRIAKLKKRDTLGFINFDSVVIADFDESLKSVATSLLYTDVSSERIHYLTLNQWFDKSLLNENSLQPIFFPSINKNNYEKFIEEYNQAYQLSPNQLSFLSYDLIGLVYFLLYDNEFNSTKNIFYKKNKFKGKIGIFEIEKNIITHQLNFYSVENNQFKKIF